MNFWPKEGTIRTINVFLLKPRTIGHITKWLCWANIIQKAVQVKTNGETWWMDLAFQD